MTEVAICPTDLLGFKNILHVVQVGGRLSSDGVISTFVGYFLDIIRKERVHPLKSMASGNLKIKKGSHLVHIIAIPRNTTESVGL